MPFCINILLTEANGNLSREKEMIKEAVSEAERYAFPKLKIDWDIDLLITNSLMDIVIPEDGVGGRARTSEFIEFAIDEKKATKNLITEMIIHELCHSARWGKNDERTNSLFDDIISEGIATYFEAEFANGSKEKTIFISTVLGRTDKENRKILQKLHGQLGSQHYDCGVIFFNGNDELPRWSGYSLGYYLVKKYLETTGKGIEEAFTDNYSDFRRALSSETKTHLC